MDLKMDDNTAIVCVVATAVAGLCYLFKSFNDMVK